VIFSTSSVNGWTVRFGTAKRDGAELLQRRFFLTVFYQFTHQESFYQLPHVPMAVPFCESLHSLQRVSVYFRSPMLNVCLSSYSAVATYIPSCNRDASYVNDGEFESPTPSRITTNSLHYGLKWVQSVRHPGQSVSPATQTFIGVLLLRRHRRDWDVRILKVLVRFQST